ncbi:MAG: cytochrome c biogenesis protein CcdA, partial [Rhodocyclaceae bacterium]|nr:cytochrome c biogenesis protein CcdA [Rhodocyclaceae bacterium]
MSGLLVAMLAGVLTTLSPCVLPVLPVVLLAALQQHRYGPLALAAGMSLAFTALGIGIATIGFSLDIGSGAVRLAAALVMIAFGAVLLSSRLQAAFARAGSPLSDRLNAMTARFAPDGLGGQFLLGLLLGAVWTPCSG